MKIPQFTLNKLFVTHNETTIVDIAFVIKHSLALVGQSGSGKSVTLKAILGMLPRELEAEIEMDVSYELIRGETLAFVPQNPFTALSPLTKIKEHFRVGRAKQIELMSLVGLDTELLDRYPPELSGGQLQRIVLAISLETTPKLLMLDEPTTALDVENRIMVIELLRDLQEEFGFQILFVTHDIESAKGMCEDIVVLNKGVVVEQGRLMDVLQNPKEAYTKRLIESNFANREFRV